MSPPTQLQKGFTLDTAKTKGFISSMPKTKAFILESAKTKAFIQKHQGTAKTKNETKTKALSASVREKKYQ